LKLNLLLRLIKSLGRPRRKEHNMSENIIFSEDELEVIRDGQVLGDYYHIENDSESQEAPELKDEEVEE
jgi:hypothetical protein